MTTKASEAETPAAAATRARCRPVTVSIGSHETLLSPVVLASGQLNSVAGTSPPTADGGYVLIVIEPIHGNACPAAADGPCTCGARAEFERVLLR